MRKIELDLEHRYQNRFVGRHRIKLGQPIVLGSSRESDIRLLGEDVGGVHAIIDADSNGWKISDMGSQHGTWIKKKPIVEHVFSGTTSVRIGGHTLRVIPRELDSQLFNNEMLSEMPKDECEFFHQVVVKRKGYLQESHLLGKNESFKILIGKEIKEFLPTEKTTWITHDFGDVEIKQRSVFSKVINDSSSEKLKDMFDPELKIPLIVASVLSSLLAIVLFLSPNRPSEELVELKTETNKYTKLIFDAKAIKKQREESQKLTKKIVGASKPKGAVAEEKTVSPQKSPQPETATTKVVSKIKAAGLSQLIGKISKRAAKSAEFVVTKGQAPDRGPSSVSLSSVGSSISKDQKSAQTGKTFKVSGVSTSGKGGGSSDYKGVAGLAAGNVGNSSVGLLEEESEVEGGLDREVIANVIKSQLGQIRYCYERQLSAKPDLYGKVQVKFTIGDAGQVLSQSIGLTTLSNAMVEGCILRRVSGWKFPVPKGGTKVVVTYPFLFKATN